MNLFFINSSFAKFIHPLDFDNSDIQKREVLDFITNQVKQDFCNNLNMCDPSTNKMMSNEEMKAFKYLTTVKDRKILDLTINTYCEQIDMCSYSTIKTMYNQYMQDSNYELSF